MKFRGITAFIPHSPTQAAAEQFLRIRGRFRQKGLRLESCPNLCARAGPYRTLMKSSRRYRTKSFSTYFLWISKLANWFMAGPCRRVHANVQLGRLYLTHRRHGIAESHRSRRSTPHRFRHASYAECPSFHGYPSCLWLSRVLLKMSPWDMRYRKELTSECDGSVQSAVTSHDDPRYNA